MRLCDPMALPRSGCLGLLTDRSLAPSANFVDETQRSGSHQERRQQQGDGQQLGVVTPLETTQESKKQRGREVRSSPLASLFPLFASLVSCVCV